MRHAILLGVALLCTTPAFAKGFHHFSEEIAAIRDAVFAEADADANGALTLEEFHIFHDTMRQRITEHRFETADTNGDGIVSLDELDAARPPRSPRGHR